MRETNFRSVPFNRASVSITTSLYDRRALDCTSDRPLIYSLNHLTYLASSSARVRDTLSTDGGIERLVSILKQCHYNDINSSSTTSSTTSSTHQLSEHEFVTKETLAAWKWSLAFQCLVFVGTRGTEDIRCRVAFCGIIPVIATVLDNYLQLMARFKCSKGKFLLILLRSFCTCFHLFPLALLLFLSWCCCLFSTFFVAVFYYFFFATPTHSKLPKPTELFPTNPYRHYLSAPIPSL